MLAATATLSGTTVTTPPGQDTGTNILLMGIDDRDTITQQEKQQFHAGGTACHCTDVMMLVHVSAARDRVSVVSLPRDSYALVPAHRDDVTGALRPAHSAKLNHAYAEGGPALAVRTVENMTGVDIKHYLQVDFRRFMDAVDEIGGVDVCTARPLQDFATRLDLTPGTHRLGGGQALQYVRSRHLDASADIGRVQRQQRFLVATLRRLSTQGVLADPVTMVRLARTLRGSVRVDQGMSVGRLLDLAAVLSRIPLSATEFTTVPVGGFHPILPGVGSTLRWDTAAERRLFSRLRQDRPLVPAGSTPAAADPPPLLGRTPPVRGTALACSGLPSQNIAEAAGKGDSTAEPSHARAGAGHRHDFFGWEFGEGR
ncbi:LCP family protein [Streptomyces sp. S.PB5]|uniref:LCP family protein n=1 Tax=Streptomyces sp. S.PB5 TaxID=3020844 RepID=UPI0025B10BB5|nr:LCP family protein [Streptomyces sp. S.PB5]MDN3022803.1 LCP family protein [Streptomyces sp. S.PB5]